MEEQANILYTGKFPNTFARKWHTFVEISCFYLDEILPWRDKKLIQPQDLSTALNQFFQRIGRHFEFLLDKDFVLGRVALDFHSSLDQAITIELQAEKLILQISWYLKDQGKNAYLFMILPRTSGAANPLYPYQHYAQGAYLFELKKYFTPHSPPLWLPNYFLQNFQTVRLKCRLKNYQLNNKVLDEMLMEYVRATQEYLAKGSLDGLYTPSNHSL